MRKTFLAAITLCAFLATANETQNAKPSPQPTQEVNPCASATTQQEMNQCSATEFQKADERLNRIYGKLMKSFNDEESKTSLRTIEKAWIQYRDLHCGAVRRQYEGGSMAPMVLASCMTTVTNHRIEEIKAAYESPDVSLE
jgi:uncharacterized protein YecT (DUF1311 family)